MSLDNAFLNTINNDIKRLTHKSVTPESVVSDTKWVTNDGLSSTTSEWPSFNSNPYSYPYSPVGNEEAIVAVLHLQHNAIDVCQKFLAPEDDSDSDEDESEDELVENLMRNLNITSSLKRCLRKMLA
ncbi:hypothetical protein KIW84_066597 [Lathyrus oleraceus]|uniref:Uncharacterized protein n=1 Tax=Pisum sativum TaxID=3888 RepID=A0A9D4WG78_PEA|nr:hypothetical protein KIW84_066594 [Pisum sativum]KAI5402193.1 hypothetical protein KIW84_066597 [Pisum sativum]